MGYSRRLGNWLLDGYGGAWFYTTNEAFYSLPNPQPQTQIPIGSFEGHVSYDFNKLHCWASLDGNFWFGGTSSLGGIANSSHDRQAPASGGTFSFPMKRHQSVKISYAMGPMCASLATIKACRWLGSIPGLESPIKFQLAKSNQESV